MTDLVKDVRIWPVTKAKFVRANGDFLVGDFMRVKFNVIEGKNGLFASLPREKYEADGETKWKDQAYVPDKEKREELLKLLVSEYEKKVGESSEGTGLNDDDVPF